MKNFGASVKRILVVDDEENVRRLVRSMLGKENVVIEAEDGEVAVHMAQSHNPDFILMDIMMPNMDGYTACCTIKKDPATKVIPVVMLTALGHELNVKLSQAMGADGYINKPFSHQDLLDTIDRFLKSPE
ncbi:Chemotaxis protein CheY [subsurface metagenome]|jgi:CheY-like chemotaxis protein